MLQREGGGRWPLRFKEECSICKAFTAEQVQQLATPTHRTRKEKEQKKMVCASPVTSIPTTLVSPTEVQLLGRVEGGRVTAETPAGKKRSDEPPKPSKKKSSSKPTSEDLKSLDDKWTQRFAWLEAMLLSQIDYSTGGLAGAETYWCNDQWEILLPTRSWNQQDVGHPYLLKLLPVPVLFRPPGMLLPAYCYPACWGSWFDEGKCCQHNCYLAC